MGATVYTDSRANHTGALGIRNGARDDAIDETLKPQEAATATPAPAGAVRIGIAG